LEDLAALAQRHQPALNARVREFEIGGRFFAFNSRPHVMGVINLSPDSWYRESVCLTTEQAVRRGKALHAQGADVVDVGAESTLAHASRADTAVQSSRLLPVIEDLRSAGILVSVETYDVGVTRECLKAGANVLNWTGTDQPERFFELAAEHKAAVIVCYVQGRNVREVADFDLKADPIPQMERYFEGQIKAAAKVGLNDLIIDPGLGFYYRNLQDSAVRVRHQMNVFLNTFRLRALGFPVCHALPHAFEYFGEEVRSAEPFFAVLAALGKTDLFRTHEVPRTKGVLDTLRVY
jgi:dihydropteroate synthase